MSLIDSAVQMCLGAALGALFIGVVSATISTALRKALEDRGDGT